MQIRVFARAYHLSMIVVVVTAVASIIGLVIPTIVYPSTELRQSYVNNDLVNLIIGLPILLVSLWLARRGRLLGLLLWPGALLYGLYNYIAYLFGIPPSWSTVLYLAIVLGSGLAIFVILKNIDAHSLPARLADAVPVKTTGWILLLFGLMFFLRAVSLMTDAIIAQTALPVSEQGVVIADVIISPLWMAGGILLLRHKPLGYASGLGLLFAASMLFIGLILVFLLQPILTDLPFVLTDILVIAGMGLFFFIPFGLYVRGVMLKG